MRRGLKRTDTKRKMTRHSAAIKRTRRNTATAGVRSSARIVQMRLQRKAEAERRIAGSGSGSASASGGGGGSGKGKGMGKGTGIGAKRRTRRSSRFLMHGEKERTGTHDNVLMIGAGRLTLNNERTNQLTNQRTTN